MYSLIKPTLAETRSFIMSHGGLLWPIGFATFGLGQALAIMAFSQSVAGGGWSMPWVYALLGGLLWSQMGYLTISGLLMNPDDSVGQQMGHALAKLPLLILTFVMAVLVMMVLLIPFLIAAQMNGLEVVVQSAAGPQASVFLIMPLLAMMLMLFAKLYLAWAGLMDGRFKGLKGIVFALALTRSRSFFFLSVALVFVLLFQASQSMGGLIGAVLTSGLRILFGPSGGSTALVALTAGCFAVIPMVIATVFSTLLYMKLSQERDVRS